MTKYQSTVTITYRDASTVTFRRVEVDGAQPVCLVITEQLTAYGGVRTHYFPWDLIALVRVE